jgi:hypothetical protein
MKKIVCVVLFLVTFSASSTSLPIESFVKHGDYLDMTIAPDGKRIFARMRVNQLIKLVFPEATTMKMVGIIKPNADDHVHSARWVSNTRVVYQLQQKQSYFDRPIATGELFAVNVDSTQRSLLFGYRAGDLKIGSRISLRDDIKASAELISTLPDEEEFILIAEYPWGKVGINYYDNRQSNPIISRLHIDTGRRKNKNLFLFLAPKY